MSLHAPQISPSRPGPAPQTGWSRARSAGAWILLLALVTLVVGGRLLARTLAAPASPSPAAGALERQLDQDQLARGPRQVLRDVHVSQHLVCFGLDGRLQSMTSLLDRPPACQHHTRAGLRLSLLSGDQPQEVTLIFAPLSDRVPFIASSSLFTQPRRRYWLQAGGGPGMVPILSFPGLASEPIPRIALQQVTRAETLPQPTLELEAQDLELAARRPFCLDAAGRARPVTSEEPMRPPAACALEPRRPSAWSLTLSPTPGPGCRVWIQPSGEAPVLVEAHSGAISSTSRRLKGSVVGRLEKIWLLVQCQGPGRIRIPRLRFALWGQQPPM